MTNDKKTKKLFIKTWGCQMNVYDSRRMADVLAPLGYASVETPEDADMVILNTCHIREKATDKVFSELGRLREHQDAKAAKGEKMIMAVAGCVAQAEGDFIMERARHVDMVFGPQTYHELPQMVMKATGERVVNTDFPTISKFDSLPADQGSQGPVAFLSIQEGCDKFCTFCVVPYTRGAEYSRDVQGILDEGKRLRDTGARELTLLGQNVNAFHGIGPDGSTWGLGRLIAGLAEIEGIERIRYMTSHPRDMDDELIDAHGSIKELMPFLHLPVQSGSDKILKAMNRKHKGDLYRDIIARMRKVCPDIALSSDFIVGFPGETEQDFEDTMTLVRDIGFASCYSFSYSARPGTPAANMQGLVHPKIMAERLQRLQTLLNEQQIAFNESFIGKTAPILFDRVTKKGQLHGRTPHNQAVHISAPERLLGQIVDAKITGGHANSLTGEIVMVGKRLRIGMNHRPDIDGLRALAVIIVILFHAHWLPGGFVGVDIFFVISGYLMASIIGGALQTGQFKIMDFYARRARRIIPAFAAVLAVTALLGIFLLLPHDAKQMGKSLIAAATLTSNHYFMTQAMDYFAFEDVAFLPLLHTWSLSVEAQFYLIFPFLMIGLYKYAPRRVAPALALIMIVSLLFSAIAVVFSPQMAFYLLPSRMWELLLGALVFFLPKRIDVRAGATGFAMIIIATLLYTNATPFPGVAALLPVIGAALILAAQPYHGVKARRFLESAPVAALAKLSYSLYLWHWPLFVMARYRLGGDLSVFETLGVLAATFILSCLTWKFVEQLFLRPAKAQEAWLRLAAPLSLLLLVAATGVFVRYVAPRVMVSALPAPVMTMAAGEMDYLQNDCEPDDKNAHESCRFGAAKNKNPDILIWGNSFARMWLPALQDKGADLNVTGIAAIRSACKPLVVSVKGAKSSCAPFNEKTLEYIAATPGLRTIILAANWSGNAEAETALDKTIAMIQKDGREIFVVMPPPFPGYHAPREIALAMLRGKEPPALISADEHKKQTQAVAAIMNRMRIKYGVVILDPSAALCETGFCAVQQDGKSLYHDRAHLSIYGAEQNSALFSPVFRSYK